MQDNFVTDLINKIGNGMAEAALFDVYRGAYLRYYLKSLSE
jgi:hypothetical protein